MTHTQIRATTVTRVRAREERERERAKSESRERMNTASLRSFLRENMSTNTNHNGSDGWFNYNAKDGHRQSTKHINTL